MTGIASKRYIIMSSTQASYVDHNSSFALAKCRVVCYSVRVRWYFFLAIVYLLLKVRRLDIVH